MIVPVEEIHTKAQEDRHLRNGDLFVAAIPCSSDFCGEGIERLSTADKAAGELG